MSSVETPRRERGHRRSDVRARIVDAARAELVNNRTGNVSLRSVARQVGISHQSITYYFADRSALFAHVAVEGLQQLEAQFTATTEAAEKASGELVVELGLTYLDFAAQNPELFDVMFGGGGGLVDPLAQEIVEARSRVWERLLAVVSAAVDDGWGGGAPAEVLAGAAWSTVHGLASLRRYKIAPDLPELTTEDLLRLALSSIRSA